MIDSLKVDGKWSGRKLTSLAFTTFAGYITYRHDKEHEIAIMLIIRVIRYFIMFMLYMYYTMLCQMPNLAFQ